MTDGVNRSAVRGPAEAQGTLQVAQIGDYSVANWGDQLYPGATRQLFATAGIDAGVSYYAPLRGLTPAGDPIAPLSEARHCKADLVLIGGGDLIRFDTRTVAMDHMSVPHESRHRRVSRLRARLFARRRFLPGPGVWVPGDGWVPGVPTALISVGVHTIPRSEEVRRAFAHCTAAWVRTEKGAVELRGAGLDEKHIVLAPDMVFALPELIDPFGTRSEGARIIKDRLGIDEPTAIFHAATFHGWPQARVESALRSLRHLPLAVLSLGAYSGEDRVLAGAARRVGAHALIDLTAGETTAVLAAAGAVFTTSMHAAIVASSFGTPVLVPGVKKTAEAFALCPVPPRLDGVEEGEIGRVMTARIGRRQTHDPQPNAEAAARAFTRVLELSGRR